jgi:hypothetical protein
MVEGFWVQFLQKSKLKKLTENSFTDSFAGEPCTPCWDTNPFGTFFFFNIIFFKNNYWNGFFYQADYLFNMNRGPFFSPKEVFTTAKLKKSSSAPEYRFFSIQPIFSII